MNKIPGLLYVTIIAICIAAIVQMIGSLNNPKYLISVACNIALIYGLLICSRIAFVFAVAAALISSGMIMGTNIGTGIIVFIVDVLILLPMFLCWDYFWKNNRNVA